MTLHRELKLGLVIVAAHVGPEDLGGWCATVLLALHQPSRLTALSVGWGWDAEVPLRPWPQAWWGSSSSGRRSYGVALCGLFFSINTQDLP